MYKLMRILIYTYMFTREKVIHSLKIIFQLHHIYCLAIREDMS